jgi:hypothetical protein
VSQQVILKKGKFPKVIEIIEQEKHNFKFLRGALADQVNYRCCVGLLLSHFGWDGHGNQTVVLKTFSKPTKNWKRLFL